MAGSPTLPAYVVAFVGAFAIGGLLGRAPHDTHTAAAAVPATAVVRRVALSVAGTPRSRLDGVTASRPTSATSSPAAPGLPPSSVTGAALPLRSALGLLGVALLSAGALGERLRRAWHGYPLRSLQPMAMATLSASDDLRSPSETLTFWSRAGYTILDVRSDMEGADGRIRSPNKGTVDIPLIQARASFDSQRGERVLTQTPNPQWLEQVTAKVPRDARVIVMCSDGRSRTAQAMQLLRGAGYGFVCGLRGGYAAWNQQYDRHQRPRSAAAQPPPADPTAWLQWAEAVGADGGPAAEALGGVAGGLVPPPDAYSGTPAQALFQDLDFQAVTLSAFPAKRLATIEESRVLWKIGNWAILDIRSELEGNEGRIRGPTKRTTDIPLFHATASHDHHLDKRVVQVFPNHAWLDYVKDTFPPEAKIVVMCGDGGARSEQAARILADAGFRNVVTMIGGYFAWDAYFDHKLAVRITPNRKQKATALAVSINWGKWTAGDIWRRGPPRPMPQTSRPRALTFTSTGVETSTEGQ